MGERIVAALAYPGVNLLDLAGPLQAFATANPSDRPIYRLRTVSERGGPVPTAPGLEVMTEPVAALDGVSIDTLIVPGGVGDTPLGLDGMVDWLRLRGPTVRRLCSICTGAFLLADAGLLDDHRVTTHWSRSQELQQRHPRLRLEPDCIYINDGSVWTSGGVTAGIDLALALIEADLGHHTAIATARQLVVFMRRLGGQSQFAAPAAAPVEPFGDLHRWMSRNLQADLRVEQLARRAGMSPRNFSRVYTAALGVTPARTVETMRLEAACHALETSTLPLKTIAERTGLISEQTLRRLVQRQFGIGPADYRLRFGQMAEA